MMFFAHCPTRQKPKFELKRGKKEPAWLKEHRCLNETPNNRSNLRRGKEAPTYKAERHNINFSSKDSLRHDNKSVLE